MADFSEVIRLAPDFADAYSERAYAYWQLDERELSNADYARAVELDDSNAGNNNTLCWNYGLQQQPQKALPYCNQAIALDPHPNYYDSRGLVHALLDEFEAAIEDFQVYIDYLEEEGDPDMVTNLEQRKAWVEELQAGVNLITPAVLVELAEE